MIESRRILLSSASIRLYLLLSLIAGVLAVSCIQKRESAKVDTDIDTTVTVKGDRLAIEMVGVDSMSVFDLLIQNHQVDFQGSPLGVFVKAIDSIENGGGYFWLYSVNDSMAQVSCDKYMTSNGDRIKWHFRGSGL